jgi:nitrous oxide reductase
MSEKDRKTDESRRSFLKFAAVAGPAAAVAATGASEAEAAEEIREEGKGLRKTAHVEAYLASARF